MLEFALLGLLKERPMHGYDLRKRLREEFGPLSNLSYGSLYPALARLEANGAIRAQDGVSASQSRESVPFTGSLGGERATTVARRATQAAALALSSRGTRGRKIYEITPSGEVLFEQLLDADMSGDDPRDFTLRLTFACHLSPSARIRLLERRRTQIAGRLERAGRAHRLPTRPLDRYELAIAEHAESVVANELAWVDALLSSERDLQIADPTGLDAHDQGIAVRPEELPPQAPRARRGARVSAAAGTRSQERRSH